METEQRTLEQLGEAIRAHRTAQLATAVALVKTLSEAHIILAQHGDNLFSDWCEEEIRITKEEAHSLLHRYKCYCSTANELIDSVPL